MAPDDEENRPSAPGHAAMTARQLLIACRQEAGRLAAGMDKLDHILAAAIAELPAVTLKSLHLIDLLRQETSGLARLLELICDEDIATRSINYADILAASPLQKQRQRLVPGKL
jgi:hypothetical protein